MVRILIAALIGAVGLFAWQYAAWEFLDLHKVDPEPVLAQEDPVLEALAGTERGVYWIPGRSLDSKEGSPEFDAWKVKHEKGPRGFLVYDPEGGEVMTASQFGIGGAIAFVICLVIALMLTGAKVTGFLGRVFLCVGMGVVIALVMDVQNWHWMNYPMDWTRGHAIDHVGGMTVVGLVMGIVLRPGRTEKPDFG